MQSIKVETIQSLPNNLTTKIIVVILLYTKNMEEPTYGVKEHP